MGILDNFINGMAGALGIKKRQLPYVNTNANNFVLSVNKPCTIYLTFNRDSDVWDGGWAGFWRGGIQGATDSVVEHTVIGVTEEMGNYMRKKYPILLTNPKIPAQAQPMEILEEIGDGASVQSLQKYLEPNTQMFAFTFNFTQEQIENILLRAYGLIGTPYDYAEIAKHVFDIIPDSKLWKVCSSYAAFAFRPVREIVKPNVKEGFETPADIYRGLFPDLKVGFYKFHC
jgi:hypothetical protein